MLLSVALILLCGMGMSWICKKLKLPGLLGMLLTGIVLGPYVLNLLDENLLNISSELRKMALIIILMRAGLGLDISGLKKIGRPAVMMCFVPATFELLGMLVLAPRLLGLSVAESLLYSQKNLCLPESHPHQHSDHGMIYRISAFLPNCLTKCSVSGF